MENSKVKSLRSIAVLAGLIHDIGKFYQRADKSLSDKGNELSDYSKNLANDICPVNDKGRFGYQHVIWTNEFLEKIRVIINKLPALRENPWSWTTDPENNLANLACNHHRPQTPVQAIITLADWWSAGIDRNQADTFEKEVLIGEKFDWGRKRYKRIPLYTPFNYVKSGSGNYGFQLSPLSLTDVENLIPHKVENIDCGNSEELYKLLWDQFMEEVVNLPTDSVFDFSNSLLFLLKKFTWSIPSNTMDMSNVSLFDHLKTTAAFADSLMAYYEEKPDHFRWNDLAKRISIADDVRPVILIGGDLSGIQKFIYNIASRKAAQSLKGRSFYLQLVVDSIIRKIVNHKEICCTLANVVFSSGGRFYIILPNTQKVYFALDEIKAEIEKELWQEHHGAISFQFATIPFSYQGSEILTQKGRYQNLSGLWDELTRLLNKKKNQRFSNQLNVSYDEFFSPGDMGADIKVCAVTGMDLPKDQCYTLDDQVTVVSRVVRNQMRLGQDLKDSEWLVVLKNNKDATSPKIREIHGYNILGMQYFLTKPGISSFDNCHLVSLNNTDFLDVLPTGRNNDYGFQFYGGNTQAKTQDGRLKTFEEFGERLGILRMDVDNLGMLFSSGLNSEKVTHNQGFAVYSTLSFQLDLFFKGCINIIREEFKDSVNILYSGGDDVFAVGKWQQIIEFAEKIYSEFIRFTGRLDITLSGGIALVGPKYPIAKAAQLAGEAVELSKNNEFNGTKNALTLFSETVSWNLEFDYVKKLKKRMVDLLENDNMPKSLLHKLMQFAESMEGAENSKSDDKSYLWRMVYFLKRMEQRNQNNLGVVSFINDLLLNDLFGSNGLIQSERKPKLIAIAARWAELETRK